MPAAGSARWPTCGPTWKSNIELHDLDEVSTIDLNGLALTARDDVLDVHRCGGLYMESRKQGYVHRMKCDDETAELHIDRAELDWRGSAPPSHGCRGLATPAAFTTPSKPKAGTTTAVPHTEPTEETPKPCVKSTSPAST